MTVVDAPKSDSLKDKLIRESNKEPESVFTPQGAKGRRNQYQLVQEFERTNFSPDEFAELERLCYKEYRKIKPRLPLLIRIDWDVKGNRSSIDSEIEHLEGILSYLHSRHIQNNTRAINLSFETFSLGQDGPNQKQKTKKVLDKLEAIFQAANPQSITDFRWEVGPVVLQRPYNNLYDPKSIYCQPLKTLLQIVSTFTNLVNFQYISRDGCKSTFEKVVSRTVACLPNLEVLVISRAEKDVNFWYDDSYHKINNRYEEKMSKLMGKTLSSLTKLKRLHLQGLLSPRPAWSNLDWKCPLEYLKVSECPYLHGEVVFPVALAFRKTLLGLMLGPIPTLFFTKHPQMEFGKHFEVLEELSIRPYLGEDTAITDDMSQAPKLKHFDIHRTHVDILSRIKNQIEGPEPAWPCLQTLGLDGDPETFGVRLDIEENLEWEKSSLDAPLRDVTEFISHKFGILDAEWDWEREVRDDHKVDYKYGTMTLSNGRMIEVKGLNVSGRDRISCKYVDTVKLISQSSS